MHNWGVFKDSVELPEGETISTERVLGKKNTAYAHIHRLICICEFPGRDHWGPYKCNRSKFVMPVPLMPVMGSRNMIHMLILKFVKKEPEFPGTGTWSSRVHVLHAPDVGMIICICRQRRTMDAENTPILK